MSPYSADDLSVHDGEPVELFKFTGPSSSLTYYYTSHNEDVDYSGDTYTAVPSMRSNVEVADHSRSRDMSISLPVSLQLVQDYAFGTPPRSLSVTIFRMHTTGGTPITYWLGSVLGFRVQGSVASARLVSLIADALRTRLSNVWFQPLCNHVLYDDRCTKTANSFRTDTTVASISGDTVTLNADGGADQYHRGGDIVRVTDSERRLILDHTGLILTLNRAFRELSGGDSVQVFAGCDRLVNTCKDKFGDNVVNFGGHPYIPTRNIFRDGLRGL